MDKLKAGSGYWRLNIFPIGGDFHRVKDDTLITEIIWKANPNRIEPSLKGCTHCVMLANGDKAAINWNNVISE